MDVEGQGAFVSDKTGIEWTEATWNPVSGCSKVSQGCKHCYAEREWPRLAAPRARPNIYTGRAFTDVKCHPEKLDIPLRWQKPRRIFVNSMSDLFHEDVPDEFINQVFEVMNQAHRHVFQVLTKRPERMLEYMSTRKWPNAVTIYGAAPLNVWLGVSIEDQATADERIPLLLQTPAAVWWISAEPLIGPLMIDTFLGLLPEDDDGAPYPGRIDWLVVGGESGPQARPMHPDWARSLRDQCLECGVPFFFKQWGEWAPDAPISKYADSTIKLDDGTYLRFVGKKRAGRELDGRTWEEYPE